MSNEKYSTHWLRNLITFFCRDCYYQWTQPGEIGTCPKCHSDNTAIIDRRVTEAKRV